MTDALWQLGGWTMIHFLWLGTAVALLGGALRFACRRAAPGVRYATSLVTFMALATTPIAIAAWLTVNSDVTPLLQPRALPGGSATVEQKPTSTPGQRPSLQNAAPPVVIDLAHAPPPPQQTLPLPSPRRGGAGGGVSSADDVDISASTITLATVVPHLPWLWLIGAPLTFALLASGLVGSERLRRKCTALTDGPAAAACEQLRQAMRITRRVSVAVCDKIAQPVLIGILRPLILLPASALSGWTPAELEMVLLHELAHVRRWDNLVNLLQRIIESALFFHPAVWLVSRQVRRDREECCDAVVVSRIERPHDYAALLVSIAAKMQPRRPAALAAASAMADHPLTGRVRRILKLEDEPMWISRRTLGLTVALPILIAYVALYAGAIAGQDSPSTKTDDPSRAAVSVDDSRGGEAARVPQKFTQPDEPGFRVFKLAHARAGMISINLEEYFQRELTAPGDGPKLRFIFDSDSNTIVVQHASEKQLKTIGKLVETYDQPKAAAKPRESGASVTKAVAAARDFIDPEIELPRLMHEITRLKDQIAETNKDLVNIEIFRQLALQSARSPAAVEKAVAESLDNDPTIATFQRKLFELQEVIQGHSEESKNLDDEKRKQLAKQLQQTEQEMQQHRAAVEKAAREQIAKMPNEAYRAAIVEHKIRYEAAMANLKKYQDELSEANRKLDELVRSNSPDKESDDPIYAIVYPIGDVETIDFQRWMQLVSSDQRIDVRWFEKNKSLVVNAPKSGHEQISELFSETRNESGDPGVEERIGVATDETPFSNALTRPTDPPVVDDAATAPQQEINWRSSLDLAKQEALQEDKLLFVYFHAKSSNPCRTFEQRTLLSVDVRAYIDDTFIPVKIDVDASPAVTAEFRIFQIPRTVVATSRGETLAQIGPNKPAFFLASLMEVNDKAPRTPNTAEVIPVVVTVKQPPIRKGDSTTAFLKLGMVWNADNTPQQIERAWEQQLTLVRSSAVISQAVKQVKEKPGRDDAAIAKRLKATFPGEGEIMELVLTAGDTTPEQDRALLQAIIDAYVQVTKSQAEASGAPTLADDDQRKAAGNELVGSDQGVFLVKPRAQPLAPGDEVKVRVVGAFPEWPLDDVFRIEEEGTLALGPAYGRVAVAGQTVAEAEKTLLRHLSKMLTDVEVQLTLYQRAANAPQNAGVGNATYLYDGKPFDQWRDLWKHELNTNRRTEAIEALAAFARTGYGKQAAETILDVAAEYDFKSYDESPEGKLRERVAQVLTLGRASRVPATDWLPSLMDRHAKDPDKWRPLMTMLISGGVPEKDYTLDPATRKLLLQIASDPKYGPNAAALRSLYSRSYTDKGDPVIDPEVAPLIKAALTGEDVANALAVLRMLSFGQLDQWPQQLDFLFHQDAAARRTARTILQWSSQQSRQSVADRLIAVLDDPKRAEDHADAIRALGVMLQAKRNAGGGFKGWPDEEAEKRISERFEQITRDGPSDLVARGSVAMGIDGVNTIDGALKGGLPGESEEYQERIKQARDKIEAETEQLVDPPNLGGGGGGLGGMGGGGTGGAGGGIF